MAQLKSPATLQVDSAAVEVVISMVTMTLQWQLQKQPWLDQDLQSSSHCHSDSSTREQTAIVESVPLIAQEQR